MESTTPWPGMKQLAVVLLRPGGRSPTMGAVLRRRHAFEFEDQPWFPAELRRYITDILHAAHRVFRIYRTWSPFVARLVEQTGERRLVDLCSGGGGPALAMAERLRCEHGLEPDLTLTDLYPNHTALERVNAAGRADERYLEQPVDASDVPEDLGGIRTMYAGFHHMPEQVARSILADACQKRRCICIFELTNNSLWAILIYLFIPGLTWLLTPLTRPLTLRRLALTYLLPVVPFLVTWDGVASHLRTYSVQELQEMTEGLDTDGYHWEKGYLWHLPVPYRFPYLIGRPAPAVRRGASAAAGT